MLSLTYTGVQLPAYVLQYVLQYVPQLAKQNSFYLGF
jgi:hypothetical protein